MARIFVFVDGGHFSDGLHAQGFSADLDYRRLSASLSQTTEDMIGDIAFYVARLPAAPYPNKAKAQLAHFELLAQQGIRVVTGSIEIRGGIFIERDVEAALATDLVAGAWRGQFAEALVISRRAAFAPAVRSARQAGCTVRSAFFRYHIDPTDGLCDAASSTAIVRSADIIKHTRSGSIPRGVHQ